MNKYRLDLGCIYLVGLSIATLGNAYATTKSNHVYERKMNGRTLVEIVGEGISTKGDTAAIIGRAQACVLRNVTSGAVSASGALNAFTGRDNTAKANGPTIELADPTNGQLIANAQVPFSYMLAGRIARARLIVEAKTEKFRVLVSSPTILYGRSPDASQIVVAAGTGGEQAIEALLAIADKVSDCILEEQKKEW